ncbi:hypothetical protein [Azospirillum sp.]|uniref:DUF968 domain-containing protein n=1 Tax=Azospirillum sp. TaxID=34012 RepID=UPI003D75D339
MALPALRQRKPLDTGRDRRDRCPGHLDFVRRHHCCVPGCDGLPIEAMHVRKSGDGGMGMKPGDGFTVSGCAGHHREQHAIGEDAFERKHGIDLLKLAAEFRAASPAWKRYLAKKDRP